MSTSSLLGEASWASSDGPAERAADRATVREDGRCEGVIGGTC